MPHSVADAFKNFEIALDEQFSIMNIHDDTADLPVSAAPQVPAAPPTFAGGFMLNPCFSSDESDSDPDPVNGYPKAAVVQHIPYLHPVTHPVANPVAHPSFLAVAQPALTLMTADANIPPKSLTYRGFEYNRKNDNKKSLFI